jgi:hypothetical protein
MIPSVGMHLTEIVSGNITIAGPGESATAFKAVGYNAQTRALNVDMSQDPSSELNIAAKAPDFMKSFDI